MRFYYTDRSPESKKQKLVEEVVAPMMIFKRELFKDDEAYQTYLQCFGELKGSIKIVVANNIEAAETIGKLVKSETEKELLQKELKICKAELHLRPHVEVLQRKMFPLWLLNSVNESSSLKWILAMEFQLSQTAKIIVNRLKKLNTRVELLDVGEALSRFYDALSDTLSHDRPIKLTTQEWEDIFEKINVDDDPNIQDTLKEIMRPISQTERNLEPVATPLNHYVLHVKFLHIDVKVDDEEETNILVKKYSGDLSNYLEKFYYPVDNRRMYTNDIFIYAKNLSYDQVNELKKKLEKYPVAGKNVKFVYHKVLGA